MNEFFAPLIERDLNAIPRVAREYAAAHSEDALWNAVTRFAVLSYAPAQHAKRAVMACAAAHEVRAEAGGQWIDLVIECARYAAASRRPWSEPPIAESIDPRGWPALASLRGVAQGDALLMLDAVETLLPLVGEKGLPALQRMVMQELPGDVPAGELDPAGSPDSVQVVLCRAAALPRPPVRRAPAIPLEPYPFARDYAQTLLAHACAPRLPEDEGAALLAAVHHNLAHGESFADFAFA